MIKARALETIPVEELLRSGVWEFDLDEGNYLPDQDETWLVPVRRIPVNDLDNRLVATAAALANGTQITAVLGNLDLEDLRSTEQFRCLSVAKDGQWFHLERYFDVCYGRSGPQALAQFLGLSLEMVFPISYDISDLASGLPEVVSGTIPSDPREILSDEERYKLIFHTQESDPEADKLGMAIHERRPIAATQMIEKRPELANMPDEYGNYPIHRAATHGTPELIELLLHHGAEINIRDKRGGTVLTHILWTTPSAREVEIARLLLARGADPNLPQKGGNTPLHLAAAFGSAEMVRALLDGGADVHARREAGLTPLHDAAWEGKDGVAKLLLQAGANVNAEDDEDMTPLGRAIHGKHKGTAKLLRAHGARG